MRLLFLIFSCLTLLLLTAQVFAQSTKLPIKGIIQNKNGDLLIGAAIDLDTLGKTVALTDSMGRFSFLTEKVGPHKLIVRFTGYKQDTIARIFPIIDSIILTVTPEHNQLNDILVTSYTIEPDKPLMGVQKIDLKEANYLPVIFGEKDIVKAIQLLPGIKAAGDGNSGFYVRGGSADQNLVLMDGATVYNASHLFGFFSMFNSDVLGDVTVYKGDYPANYGGRLSSVLDISTKNGNTQDFHGNASIGLITSHLSLEGPLKKNKGSIMFSARRTYVDAILKLYPDSSISNNTLNFYDINGKAYYKFDNRNSIYASYYKGRDNLGIGTDFVVGWGNRIASVRFNHIFNNRFLSNTYLTYSGYDYDINIQQFNNTIRITSPFPEFPFSFDYKYNASNVKIRSTIDDYGVKQIFQFSPSQNNVLNFGFSTIYHSTRPSSLYTTVSSSYNNLIQSKKHGLESAVWFTQNLKINKEWEIHYGTRLTLFQVLGPGTYYKYDKEGNVVDSSIYKNYGTVIRNYFNLEPRINVSYSISENSIVKFGYNRNTQNIHLLTNISSSTPTDIWLPSSNNIKPEIADQVSAGFTHQTTSKSYEFTTEVYYKKLYNQIDYRNGADLQANPQIEGQLVYGDGRAYGWENLIRKNKGKLTGWIGYTLARTEKRFSAINGGKYYPSNQDRTHEISVVAIYKYNKKWTFSGDWVYYTGNATTFPIGRYLINGMIVNYYGDRNQNRMPSYHRLDLSATLLVQKPGKTERSWTFSIYNVYGRENAYSIDFIKDPDNSAKSIVQQTSLFRWVPSISYNVKF